MVCKAPVPIEQHREEFKRVSLELEDKNNWHTSKFKMMVSVKRIQHVWIYSGCPMARKMISQNNNNWVIYAAVLDSVPHLNGGQDSLRQVGVAKCCPNFWLSRRRGIETEDSTGQIKR